MKRLKLFAFALMLSVVGIAFNSDAETGITLTAGIGLVATMKTKGVALTEDQEKFINGLDEAFEAKNANSFADIEKQVKEWKEKMKEQDEQIKKAAALEKNITDLTSTVTVLKDAADKNQEAVDKLIASQKQISLAGNVESFKDMLAEGLKTKADALKNYNANGRTPVSINIDKGGDMVQKVVGDIGSANFTISGTQTFAGPTMLPGVARIAYPQTRMRDIFGTTPVTTDSVSVIRGVAGEGGPTGVAAGALKPQSDADWVKVIIPITKIAHHYNIPEEWLEDVSWLSDDITQTGVAELIKLENQKIVSNVTANEFTGLVQNSTAYAAPTGLANAIASANNYDVLVAAQTQLRNGNRDANVIFTDNDDFAKMILTKASTGEYVFGAPNMSIPNVFGVPIYPVNVTALAGKFIVGDRNYATVAVRSGISVRFFDQHANNAIYNMVTVVIEERLALVVKRTDAFIYGDFASARTRLDPAVVDA